MDRSDEQKGSRAGDILGLGDVVAGDNTAPHTSTTPEEARKRHERMQQGADDVTGKASDMPRGHGGATGIDMGAGGEGTDVE